jgi:hypothetical protein
MGKPVLLFALLALMSHLYRLNDFSCYLLRYLYKHDSLGKVVCVLIISRQREIKAGTLGNEHELLTVAVVECIIYWQQPYRNLVYLSISSVYVLLVLSFVVDYITVLLADFFLKRNKKVGDDTWCVCVCAPPPP